MKAEVGTSSIPFRPFSNSGKCFWVRPIFTKDKDLDFDKSAEIDEASDVICVFSSELYGTLRLQLLSLLGRLEDTKKNYDNN